jgi:alkylhydroperoxidase/carboxymuconolactone decarboxylase family protein YurZ
LPEYLPDVYTDFRRAYPEVAQTLDALGAATGAAGPLEERAQRLVKLGIAIGGLAEGAVRSNTRRALELGISAEELRHVALLAITTASFPTAIAGLSWIEEVLGTEA